MAKRTTPSLAFSEYVSPDPDNSFQVWQARLRLIEATKRVYPIFLKKLSADVFPLYGKLAKEGKLAKGRNDFGKALWGKSPFDALTDEGGLKSALQKWAADFNAEADWLMVGALRTLQGWYVAPDWRESLAWNPHHGRRERPAVGKAFEFRYPGWEVQLLTWQSYSKSLRQSFEKKLLVCEKETRKLAESMGLVRARRQYSPDNLEWFVLYQFAGMTSNTIADSSAVEGKACMNQQCSRETGGCWLIGGITCATRGRTGKPDNQLVFNGGDPLSVKIPFRPQTLTKSSANSQRHER
jgi:hypothetical protein